MDGKTSLMCPVYVQWFDATSEDAWEELENVIGYKPHIVHSVGFLVEETESFITLTLNSDPKRGAISQFIVIPKGFLISKQVLRLP